MSVRKLSPELQKKAEEELNEVPGRITADLKDLKDWLKEQPHLTARTDDQFLLGFLRGCKFNLQETKDKLDQFYTVRTLAPEFFSNRDPLSPEIQEMLKANLIFPLPKSVDPAGPRIVLIRWKGANPETMPVINLLKIFIMSVDVLMNEDDMCMISGGIAFIDYTDYHNRYTMQLNPTIAKKFAYCFYKNYPLELKELHCIYTPPMVEAFYNVAKPRLPDKLKKSSHIYKPMNSEKVYEFIPKSVLPKDYGGDNTDSIEELGAAWRKKLESYREWFLEDSKYCSNEELRPGGPKTSADLFGMEKNFRKLELD